MDLFDMCLESVMCDYYCTEGFKEGLMKAGKAVVKGIARAIDFLINVARQMINIFGNVIRKLRGKDPKVIQDKHIIENLVMVSKKVKKVKHDMAKAIATYNNVEVYDNIEQAKKSGIRTDDDYDSRAYINNIKNNIKDRHAAASKIMNDAYKNIMEDFVHDLNDIDSMKKQMPDDMKVSENFINDIKETAKKSDEVGKELDGLLKDLNNDVHVRDLDDDKDGKKFDEFMRNKGGKLVFD